MGDYQGGEIPESAADPTPTPAHAASADAGGGNSTSKQVSPKVYGGGIGGALALIVVWLLHQFAAVDMPPEVGTAIGFVIVVIVGYFVPDPTRK